MAQDRRRSRDVPATLPLPRDSVTHRIACEPVTILFGGPRALLLQVAHDVVAAGVRDHSDYAQRPWSRLLRTIQVMSQLGIGPPEKSRQMTRFLKQRHAVINGTLPDGSPYRALDPENMVWVWATLVDTMVVIHETYVRKLGHRELERFYAEQLLVAEGCGIPLDACPPTWPEFRAYVDGTIADRLAATDVAKDVARTMQRPPLPFPVGWAAAQVYGVLGPALLPGRLRPELGYAWTPAHVAAHHGVRVAAQVATRLTPGRLRRIPGSLLLAGSAAIPPPGPRRRPRAVPVGD